jgi:hypothetical protein
VSRRAAPFPDDAQSRQCTRIAARGTLGRSPAPADDGPQAPRAAAVVGGAVAVSVSAVVAAKRRKNEAELADLTDFHGS